MTLFDHQDYVAPIDTPLTAAGATMALKQGFINLYSEEPRLDTLSILWAQSALETYRWKSVHNNNFGHLKRIFKPSQEGIKFTMFATGENLWNSKKKKMEYKWFEPPHYQTAFRAYETPSDGAADYIKLVSQRKRYKKAWSAILQGDPKAYSYALYEGGYYTANPEKYTAGVVSLTNEFKRKYDKLISNPDEDDIDDTEIEALINESMSNIIVEYNIDEDIDSDTVKPRELDWSSKLKLLFGI